MVNKIYFLCDGEKEDCKRTYCYKNTNDEPCKRTADINHAKNFEKMPHGGYREKEDGKTWEEEYSALVNCTPCQGHFELV